MGIKIRGMKIIPNSYANYLLQMINQSEFKGKDAELITDIKKKLLGLDDKVQFKKEAKKK